MVTREHCNLSLEASMPAIRERVAFRGATLRGMPLRTNELLPSVGALPERWAQPLREAQRERVIRYAYEESEPVLEAPTYLVFSCAEVLIAWYLVAGEWVVPDIVYKSFGGQVGPAITRHQSLVRSAVVTGHERLRGCPERVVLGLH